MLVDGAHPTAWIDVAELMLSDIGDFRIALGDIPASLKAIEEQAAAVDHLVALGGEHSITLALLRALARRKGPLALVHFDAHVDTWPDNFGQPYAHGSVFYHAIEERLVDPRRMIQIGFARRFNAMFSTGQSRTVSPSLPPRKCMSTAQSRCGAYPLGRRGRSVLLQLRHRCTRPGFCAWYRHARDRWIGVVAGAIDPAPSDGSAFCRDGCG